MKESHIKWQKRVLAENPYLVLQASNKVSLHMDKEEAQKKMQSLPNYIHTELFKQIDISQKDNYESGLVLSNLDQVSVIGGLEYCTPSRNQPTEIHPNKTLFARVS